MLDSGASRVVPRCARLVLAAVIPSPRGVALAAPSMLLVAHPDTRGSGAGMRHAMVQATMRVRQGRCEPRRDGSGMGCSATLHQRRRRCGGDRQGWDAAKESEPGKAEEAQREDDELLHRRRDDAIEKSGGMSGHDRAWRTCVRAR